jgi:hypothetical protein
MGQSSAGTAKLSHPCPVAVQIEKGQSCNVTGVCVLCKCTSIGVRQWLQRIKYGLYIELELCWLRFLAWVNYH